MTFYRWLMKQKKRDDNVGDFARDVAADKPQYRRGKMPYGNFRTTLAWRRYLKANGAGDSSFRSLEDAWREYCFAALVVDACKERRKR